MTADAVFYDALEARDPAEREAALMAALPLQVAHAKRLPAYAVALAGVDAASITSRQALASLPVTRKSELFERQKAQRETDPFGGFSAIGWRSLRGLTGARRVFQSPGPIYEPEGQAADYWRMARSLYAAGFRAGDLVHNCFSYHLTPAGSMLETAAHAIGCTVFPGGVGNTELQLQAMSELRPDGFVGTPSFLRILLDSADQTGIKLPSLRKAMVGGEALPPSLRDQFRARGIEAFQNYGTADLGLVAYETAAREGLVLDEQVILEIVRPGGSDALPDGEVGEIVVTTLNPDYPLLRFGTGDLSAVLPGRCPTGRSNTRIKGWMGRADQTAKVRGMFVHPSQVAEVLKRHPEIGRARLVVEGEMANDHMTLRVEAAAFVAGGASSSGANSFAEAVAQTLRSVSKLRCEVELCAPGSLPNDGKVIEDARRYE